MSILVEVDFHSVSEKSCVLSIHYNDQSYD